MAGLHFRTTAASIGVSLLAAFFMDSSLCCVPNVYHRLPVDNKLVTLIPLVSLSILWYPSRVLTKEVYYASNRVGIEGESVEGKVVV